jgi:hypothetical protein
MKRYEIIQAEKSAIDQDQIVANEVRKISSKNKSALSQYIMFSLSKLLINYPKAKNRNPQ